MSTAEVSAKSPKYEIVRTEFGVWKSLDLPNGRKFRQFTSHAYLLGRPLLGMAVGVDPETGRMATAEGFIAIGQRAKGVIAIGQFVNGVLAIGQFATGRVCAVGQFVAAPFALGQMSIGLLAVGQMGAAGCGIFQFGATVFAGRAQFLLDLSKWIPAIW